MPAISTADRLADLKSLAQQASPEYIEFLLVPDCGQWAASNGISLGDRSPRAMAVRGTLDGQARVVLRSEYEEVHLIDQAAALLAAGWRDQAAEVKNPDAFLRFLVLHELAHLLNNWGQEHEQSCNEWAFQRLGWW